MKKTLLSLSIIATMVASLFNLSSCGNDDSTPTPARTISEVEISINTEQTSFMNDSLMVFTQIYKSNNDTLAYVFDANHTETWFKVPASEFPVDLEMKYYWFPKDGMTLGNEFIYICKKFLVSARYVMSDGTRETTLVNSGLNASPTLSTGSRLMDQLVKDQHTVYTFRASIDKEGHLTRK